MPQSNLSSNLLVPGGALKPNAGGVQGDLLISHFHGELYHQAYTGSLFMGANPTAVTTSAGLATTCVGLILSNPAGTGKNLILRRVGAILVVVPAAFTGSALITGFAAGGVTVHTTPLTIQNPVVGGAVTASVAKLDSAATLVGTPVYSLFLTATPAATTGAPFNTDLQGSVIIPPGGYAALGTTVASPASGFLGSIMWEESPV